MVGGVAFYTLNPKEKSRYLSKDKCDFFAICGLKPKNIVELTYIFREFKLLINNEKINLKIIMFYFRH